MSESRIKELARNVSAVRAVIEAAEKRSGRRPGSVTLLAVSKNFPAEDVAALPSLGQTSFGENRVQELLAKQDDPMLQPLKVDWHLIGTLQTNKAKTITGRVSLIHSIDRIRILEAVERCADALGVVQDVLLEVNVSGEASKSGFGEREAVRVILERGCWPHIRIRGFMTMAPFEKDPEKTRPVFSALRERLEECRKKSGAAELQELSMGMTNDYRQAIEEGATIVRIGSAIFGSRRYNNMTEG